jgi:hypothetical protein
MFSSIGIASAESEPLRLWRSESDLAARRQAALDKAATAARKAGEQFLDGGEAAVSGAADAIARLRAEADILQASIEATRRRRKAAVELQAKAKLDPLRSALTAKQSERADHVAAVERIAEQISNLEGAVVVPMAPAGRLTRSKIFSQEIEQLQIQIATAEHIGARLGSEIESDSVANLLTRIEAAAPTMLVPSAFTVVEWAAQVEAKAQAERPDLIRGHLELQREIITETPHGRTFGGTGARETGPPVHVHYRRRYSLAFSAGLIDRSKSSLAFLGTEAEGRGPVTFHAAESASR